jgi:hypothetical protein
MGNKVSVYLVKDDKPSMAKKVMNRRVAVDVGSREWGLNGNNGEILNIRPGWSLQWLVAGGCWHVALQAPRNLSQMPRGYNSSFAREFCRLQFVSVSVTLDIAR